MATAGNVANIRNVVSSVKEMAEAISRQECALSKKLCVSLDGLCHCGEDPNFPIECCTLSDEGKEAITKIVESIDNEEAATTSLVITGSEMLSQMTAADACNAQTILLFDDVAGLASAIADIEDGMGKKLCLSVNTLCCGTQGTACDLTDEVKDMLGNMISTIADTEEAANNLVESGASTLTCIAGNTASTAAQMNSALAGAKSLTDAAARIEEATAKKLSCAVAALCDVSGGKPCDCDCACTDTCTAAKYDCNGNKTGGNTPSGGSTDSGSSGGCNCPACKPCAGQLSLPINEWPTNTVLTCSKILDIVFNPSLYDSTTNPSAYIASGVADPNTWISIGGKIKLQNAGIFNGFIELDDIFVTQTDSQGNWAFTMYQLVESGLIYADGILRERNYWSDGGNHGISYLLHGQDSYYEAAPGEPNFKRFAVDYAYDEIVNFINGGYANFASDMDSEIAQICNTVSTLIAIVFANLFGRTFSGINIEQNGFSDIALCLVVKEYVDDPRIVKGVKADNLIGTDERCFSARFEVTSTRAFSEDAVSPRLLESLNIFRKALFGITE
jgi:hypothetical protein